MTIILHFWPCLFLLLHWSTALHPPPNDLGELKKYRDDLQKALQQVEDQIETFQSERHLRYKRNATTTTTTTQSTTTPTPVTSDPPTTTTTTSVQPSTNADVEVATTDITTTPLPVTKATQRRNRPVQNLTTECHRWDRLQLIQQLKVHGTYNPDFMAWDVSGVRRFLMKTIVAFDQRHLPKERYPMFQKNVDALEQMISDLDLKNCDVKSSEMRERLHNITADMKDYYEYKMSIELHSKTRRKRQLDYIEQDISLDRVPIPFGISRNEAVTIARLINDFNRVQEIQIAYSHDDPEPEKIPEDDDGIGVRHVYQCDKRGSMHEGYLRMCTTCRGIRWMPNNFFPPFINEVLCEKEKSCLYFYDYPHGKCLQKHLNFQILHNIGTEDCQIWQRYDLNVPVCCECFVDHMSFFAKYV